MSPPSPDGDELGWDPGPTTAGATDRSGIDVAKGIGGLFVTFLGVLVSYGDPVGMVLAGVLVGGPIGLFYYGGVEPALRSGGVSGNVVGVAIGYTGVVVALVAVEALPMAFLGGLTIGLGLMATVVFFARA